MKYRTAKSNNHKLVKIEVLCTRWIVQKMLLYGQITVRVLRMRIRGFATPVKTLPDTCKLFTADDLWYMLMNSLEQPLRCVAYVLVITVARVQ